jgi:hypothetical protein
VSDTIVSDTIVREAYRAGAEARGYYARQPTEAQAGRSARMAGYLRLGTTPAGDESERRLTEAYVAGMLGRALAGPPRCKQPGCGDDADLGGGDGLCQSHHLDRPYAGSRRP